MRTILIIICMLAVGRCAVAQNAVNDLSIIAKYHIDAVIEKGKVHVYPTITNNSKSDYKDITYKIEYQAADGTVEGSENFTWHDFIGGGTSKKIKGLFIKCPKDCKSLVLSIVSGTKLDAVKN